MRWPLTFLLSLLFLTACQPSHQLFTQRILSFGTLIDISIAIQPSQLKQAENATLQIENLLKQRHKQWHAWLPGELFNLNKELQTTGSANASKDLTQLVIDSKIAYQKSSGLFNPAMGKLIEAWGFHDPKLKNLALVQKLKQHIPNMDDINVLNQTITTNNKQVQLDFGGIAKGLAIKEIKSILQSQQLHNYLINIGGDLYASGDKFNQPWTIGIQDPFRMGAIGGISLHKSMSLFTSGNYQRYYFNNKVREHHIINPKTGNPSTSISSATIMHPDPTLADVAATTFMIAPQQQWLKIARQLGIKNFLIITEDKQIWVSKNMFEKTSFNTPYKIHIIRADL